MISIYKIEKNNVKTSLENENEYYTLVELRGLSTDEKPTEIEGKKIDNGSTFICIDTGDIYFYDLENEQWNEV